MRPMQLVPMTYREPGTGAQWAVVEARCGCGYVAFGFDAAQAVANSDAHRCSFGRLW